VTFNSVGKNWEQDSDKFMIEFQTLASGFDLSLRDVQFLLANCCTPTEREKFSLLLIGRKMRHSLGIP
jgi:hypothetical protein